MADKAKDDISLDLSGIVDGTAVFAGDVTTPLGQVQDELRDGLVSVSPGDTHVKHLLDALQAGDNITLTEVGSGNNQIRIDADAPAGGVTEVSAGVGIAVSPSPIVDTGSVALRGLADMGTPGQLLATDGADFGFVDAPSGGGGWDVIDSDLGIASSTPMFDITSIPPDWDEFDLTLFIRLVSGGSTTTILRVNGNTTSGNYRMQRFGGEAGSAVASRSSGSMMNAWVVGDSSPANLYTAVNVRFYFVRDSGKITSCFWNNEMRDSDTWAYSGSGHFLLTDVIHSIQVSASVDIMAGSGFVLRGRTH